jgi:hypothetical protein
MTTRQIERPTAGSSCFILTTWMLSATKTLDLPDFDACIGLMPIQEAEGLADPLWPYTTFNAYKRLDMNINALYIKVNG